jgi:hypothetical protein
MLDDDVAMDLLKRPAEVPAMPIRPGGPMMDNGFVLIKGDEEPVQQPVQRPLRHRSRRGRGILRRLSPTKEEPEGLERGGQVEGG